VSCSSVATHLEYVPPPDAASPPSCICAAGYTLANGLFCAACPPGGFSRPGKDCEDCDAGTFTAQVLLKQHCCSASFVPFPLWLRRGNFHGAGETRQMLLNACVHVRFCAMNALRCCRALL
jgi:hypothetical protein